MSIVFDFADIKRRMDRKPERDPVSLAEVGIADAIAALRAEIDATERQIEDDGWITLWAY